MTIYYIDPSLGNDANDGLSELTPEQNWTAVTWAAGNSYKQKRQTTYTGTVNIGASGTSDTNRVILTSYGTGAKPIIDGNAGAIAISGNGIKNYITIDGFETRNTSGSNGQINLFDNGTGQGGHIVQNCAVHLVRGNSSTGIAAFGPNVKYLDNEVYDCQGDAIYHQGNNVEIARLKAWDISVLGGTGGDCIQIYGTAALPSNNFYVHDCYLDHSSDATKQCFIVNNDGTGTGGRFLFNTCLGSVNSMAFGQIGCLVFGNLCRSPTSNGVLIQAADTLLFGNIFDLTLDSHGVFFDNLFDHRRSVAVNNTVIGPGAISTKRGINHATTSPNGDGCKIHNNIVSGFLHGIRRHTGTTTVESYNDVFNCGTPFSDEAAASIAGGTGSITTDPQLRSDYSLPSTSPCKGTGTFVGHYQDYYGKRFNLAAIDMGAVAYSTPPSITTRTITTRSVTTRSITSRRKVAG